MLILDGLDIDWEEHLSHLTGDIVAHKMGNLVRGIFSWGKQTTKILSQDAAEYLQEESRELPNRREVDAFLKNIDILRSDVDRLEMRVSRLSGRLQKQLNERAEHRGEGKPS
jgi:ubiquinone biosynthesis protein UbiJ